MDSQIIFKLLSLFVVVASGPLVIFLIVFSNSKV